jgi:Ca2+-binding EF-hand superfamily protein
MSSLKDETNEYKDEIKNSFKLYNDNKKDIIQTKQFNDFINIVDVKNKKNKFMNDSIKTLIASKQEEKDENISSDEYISYLENKLNNGKTNNELKNIFNVFCDSQTEKISWNSFPLIAKELGNNELSNNLFNLIKQSKLYLKDINYEEFLDIMNAESDEEKENINIKSNVDTIENNNINEEEENFENIKINDYIDNYEEIPTYKERKILLKNKNKEYDEESSKSINKESDDIIIEEKSSDCRTNDNNEVDKNTKISKRYHRRYRSKMTPNYNNENNNIENINTNHKSFNKYRKKFSYH